MMGFYVEPISYVLLNVKIAVLSFYRLLTCLVYARLLCCFVELCLRFQVLCPFSLLKFSLCSFRRFHDEAIHFTVVRLLLANVSDVMDLAWISSSVFLFINNVVLSTYMMAGSVWVLYQFGEVIC